MRRAALFLSKALTLVVGLSPLGCLERYVVPREAFEKSKALDRDWPRYSKPVAVSARRASDGQTVFVRADELQADGPAVGGSQHANTANIGPPAGAVVMIAGLGCGIGAIVLATRRHPDACASSTTWCIDLSGLGDAIGAIPLGTSAALLTLVGLGVIAATARPHRYEVAPGNQKVIYVGADGAVHF